MLLFALIAGVCCFDDTVVAFVYTSHMYSAILRSDMTAWQLSKSGVQSMSITTQELMFRHRTIDVCVFTKFVDKTHVQKCRSLGAKLVLYDVVDVFTRTEANEIDDAVSFVDGFLVATQEHCAAIAHPLCVIWPHHHTNFGNFRRQQNRKVQVLASIGMNLTLPSTEDVHSLQLVAAAHNLSFQWLDYDTLGPPSRTGAAMLWHQSVHHTFSHAADLAVIWQPGHNETRLKVDYGAVTRLIYWMSHGVPVIFYPYRSYLAAVGARYPLESCTDFDCVDRRIDSLRTNDSEPTQLYKDCVDIGLKIANEYSLCNSVAILWAFVRAKINATQEVVC